MTSHSIGTFQHFFGETAEYVVYTDEPEVTARGLRVAATILDMAPPGAEFVDHRSLWLKWAPRFRHDVARTEFHVDSDFFLVGEPAELRAFVQGDGRDFVVSGEHQEFGEMWRYGNFARHLTPQPTAINTGLFGQRSGHDLTSEFRAAYRWWLGNVSDSEVQFHDEQGGVALALRESTALGRVNFLSPDRYKVVCPLNDPPVETLDGLAGIQATFPARPAFWKFLPDIKRISGLDAGAPSGDGGEFTVFESERFVCAEDIIEDVLAHRREAREQYEGQEARNML